MVEKEQIRLSKEERSDKHIGSEDRQYRTTSSQSKTITRGEYQDDKRAKREKILEYKADELLKEIRADFREITQKIQRIVRSITKTIEGDSTPIKNMVPEFL